MENSDTNTPRQPIVELEDVRITNDNGVLLDHVSMRLDEGEFVYLIGKSGAGKTSLLRSLYADLPIESGRAEVCGIDVCRLRRRRVPMLRRQIGIVFQNFRLLDDRDVYHNLLFVLRATGWKNRREMDQRIEQMLDLVGLSDKGGVIPNRLSEGEQQRVGVARALINSPKLVLADEPTGNLDPVTSSEIMQLMIEMGQKTHTTMFLSTHDFMMIDRFPARVLLCENGTIVDTTQDSASNTH